MTILKKYITAAVAIMALAGCEKNTFGVTDRSTPSGVAFVKVAYLSPYNISNNTVVYFNGEKLTNSLVYATSFPGSGMNMTGSTATSDYLALTPGSHNVAFIVPVTATANPLMKVYETTVNFDVDKKQTLYVTDTAATTSSFVLNDNTDTPDSGFYKLRLVNTMPNVPSMDVYRGASLATSTLLQGNIKYASGTDFMTLPIATPDSFFIRPSGAATTTVPIIRRGFPLGSQRIFTLLARGYNGQTSVSRGINLSVIINQ